MQPADRLQPRVGDPAHSTLPLLLCTTPQHMVDAEEKAAFAQYASTSGASALLSKAVVALSRAVVNPKSPLSPDSAGTFLRDALHGAEEQQSIRFWTRKRRRRSLRSSPRRGQTISSHARSLRSSTNLLALPAVSRFSGHILPLNLGNQLVLVS